MFKKTTTTFGAALCVASAASAQATNDDCASAIAAPLGATAFDTTVAVDEGLIPFNCAANGGPDVWYSYTAASTSDVAFDLCGSSYDTAMTLYSGNCAGLIEIVCNDDFCGLQSGTTATGVSVGDQFLIRIAGYNGGTGFGTLNIAEVVPPPGNEQRYLRHGHAPCARRARRDGYDRRNRRGSAPLRLRRCLRPGCVVLLHGCQHPGPPL